MSRMRFRLVTKVDSFLDSAATIDGAIFLAKRLSVERCDSVHVKDHDEPAKPLMCAVAEGGKAYWTSPCKRCGKASSACSHCEGRQWVLDQVAE